MNSLAALGGILLFALMAGHLVKVLRIPEVTGYILVGVLVGPSASSWLTHANLESLGVFSEVALGLILFSIGSVFDFERLRHTGPALLRVTLLESAMAALCVSVGMLLTGQPWPVALFLGAIAIETAAASTLMVMRECDAAGPLTDTLMGVIAINNIVCIVAYSLVAAAVELHGQATSGTGLLHALFPAFFPLIWQLVGSVALGYLAGLLLAWWSSRVLEHGEVLILLSGCVLLCVGVANLLDLSPLVASLALGATVVNLSERSRGLFAALTRTDPPLYAIFFVIAGADLDLSLLWSLGVVGLVYVVGRTLGKVLGARVGSHRVGAPDTVQRLLGYSMLPQAGLAIGLVLATRERFPGIAPTVTAVVLGAVTVFELVGPLATRYALVRGGEAGAPGPSRG